jgi:hypothetical protein
MVQAAGGKGGEIGRIRERKERGPGQASSRLLHEFGCIRDDRFSVGVVGAELPPAVTTQTLFFSAEILLAARATAEWVTPVSIS